MKIYKYTVNQSDNERSMSGPVQFNVPIGARVLDIQWQQGVGIVMWALVDTEAEQAPLKLRLYGTGDTIPADLSDKLIPIKTVQTQMGLVWHVFIETDDPQLNF